MALTKPVRPRRAATDRLSAGLGCFTIAEVMLMIRPKPRSAMPSITARISRMPVTMLLSAAASHCSRSNFRQSPTGGPPALLTRMSGFGQAASAASAPAWVVMSPGAVFTSTL